MECPNTLVECPHKKMGCEERVKRCELEEHKTQFGSKHLELSTLYAVSKVEMFEIKLKRTELENAKLNTRNAELTNELKFLRDTIRKMDSKIEKFLFPVVLKDEINGRLIDYIDKTSRGSFYEPASCHNFLSNQINFFLNYHYARIQKLMVATIRIKLDKDKIVNVKWPFRAKFKLTIVDREEAESSLVFETGEQELQPKSKEMISGMDEATLAEIPGAVLTEKRFRDAGNRKILKYFNSKRFSFAMLNRLLCLSLQLSDYPVHCLY